MPVSGNILRWDRISRIAETGQAPMSGMLGSAMLWPERADSLARDADEVSSRMQIGRDRSGWPMDAYAVPGRCTSGTRRP